MSSFSCAAAALVLAATWAAGTVRLLGGSSIAAWRASATRRIQPGDEAAADVQILAVGRAGTSRVPLRGKVVLTRGLDAPVVGLAGRVGPLRGKFDPEP